MALNTESIRVGQDEYVFEPQVSWGKLPAGWTLNEVVGIDVDSQDRVFVFCRSDHPIVIFDRNGKFLGAWGEGLFKRPHGLFIASDDSVFCTDDVGHAVYQFTPDGDLRMTLGTPGQPSDTGIENDYRTVKQSAGPFNLPTAVALSPQGEIYVSDGYGNARVHKFSADGELIRSWGDPGERTGQFGVPHGVSVRSDGTVFVCDRENTRIQLFSPDGDFLDQWTNVVRPCQAVFDADDNLYVAELGLAAGLFAGNSFPDRENVPARVSVFDRNGKLRSRWGSGQYGRAGELFAAHGIAVDSNGDLYVGEVRPGVYGPGVNPEAELKAPPEAPVFQKFVRQSYTT